jgi:hypothetical protein
MALGTAVLASGVLIWITWGVLRPSGQHFWSWIGISGVSLTAIGAVGLIVGFVMPDESKDKSRGSDRQSLIAGPNSTNAQAAGDVFQARRDINMSDRRGKSEDAAR